MDFDRAATAQMYPEVIQAMIPYLQKCGNPSSLHRFGREAKAALENSREIIAAALGCSADEVYFTSGGTESNNWIIKGLKNTFRFHPVHIISSEIEHHSITEALKSRWSICEDLEYSLVGTDKSGVIDLEELEDEIRLNTKLCSIQMVNNETGIVQPTSLIGEKCRENNIFFHTDAVQSFGHMPINVKKQHIDALSASGHKLGAGRGIGLLYISNDCKSQFLPLLNGGSQERGLRASTENVAAAVGFAKAVEISTENMREHIIKEAELYTSIVNGIMNIDGIHIHGDADRSDRRHLNIGIDGIRAEELITMLDEQDVFVSSGSACNSSSNKPSHVLKAMGLSDEEANSSIRISFDYTNTQEEVEYLLKMLTWDIDILRNK